MKRWLALCWMAVAASAQTPKLAFEVATIKLNTSGDGRMQIGGGGPGGSGRFTVTNLPLRQLIVLAYMDRRQPPLGQEGLINGGPGWVSTDRYDIDARPEAGFVPTLEQQQQMLQALLEERFGLKIRRETKDGPIYALVVGKDGPKLKKSTDQTPVSFGAPPPPPAGNGPGGAGGAIRAGGPGAPPPPIGPGGPQSGPLPRGIMMMGMGQMRATAQTVAGFAGMLSGQAGRKVVDRTNLAGLYDFELKWTPDQLPNGANLPPGVTLPQIDPNGPSLFTALQEQLGLKLESATGPLDSLVIEKVEKPTEN